VVRRARGVVPPVKGGLGEVKGAQELAAHLGREWSGGADGREWGVVG